MIVLLGRAEVTVCSHRLSIQTIVVSDTAWPQFAMQVLTVGCKSPVWGRGGRRGLKMGPLSNPVMISYRLIIAYLSPFSQCSDLSLTGRQTDGRTELV